MGSLAVVCAMVYALSGVVADDTGAAAIRDLLCELLQIEPPRVNTGGLNPPPPPTHMLELYRQFSRDSPTTSAATTVRNILSTGTA